MISHSSPPGQKITTKTTDLQTVAPQDATSYAKPLKAQPVKKGRIWGLFLVGATGLFGGAVALERNSNFFPAIAKANQAIAATREAQKVTIPCRL